MQSSLLSAAPSSLDLDQGPALSTPWRQPSLRCGQARHGHRREIGNHRVDRHDDHDCPNSVCAQGDKVGQLIECDAHGNERATDIDRDDRFVTLSGQFRDGAIESEDGERVRGQGLLVRDAFDRNIDEPPRTMAIISCIATSGESEVSQDFRRRFDRTRAEIVQSEQG